MTLGLVASQLELPPTSAQIHPVRRASLTRVIRLENSRIEFVSTSWKSG